MSDLIERDKAIDVLDDFQSDIENCVTDAYAIARQRMTVIPSADTDLSGYSDKLWKTAYERGKADRPQGEWIDAEIPLESGGSMPIQACNLCKTFYPLAYTGGGHRFCPNCGARMKGAETEG